MFDDSLRDRDGSRASDRSDRSHTVRGPRPFYTDSREDDAPRGEHRVMPSGATKREAAGRPRPADEDNARRPSTRRHAKRASGDDDMSERPPIGRAPSPWPFYVFLVALLTVGILYVILPARDRSDAENRKLAGRPKWSLDAFFSGEYQEAVDAYYADQLPLRDGLIRLEHGVDRHAKHLFVPGDQEVIFRNDHQTGNEGENLGQEGKERVTFKPPTKQTKPSQDAPSRPDGTTEPGGSDEATSPTTAPGRTEHPSDVPSTSETASTEAPETPPATGTEPAPDTERPPTTEQPTTLPVTTLPPETPAPPTPEPTQPPTPDTEVEEPTQIGGILIQGKRAMELFGYREDYVDEYAQLMNRLRERLPGVEVYNLMSPTSAEFYSPENYHSGGRSQRLMLDDLAQKLDPGIRRVDTYDAMEAHKDEYIYFRTDHHWTQLGAYYAYCELAKQAGFTPLALDAMAHGVIEGGFLGSLYRYSNDNPTLRENPDQVEWWEPPVETEGYAFESEAMDAGWRIALIRKEVGAANKYLAFTEGDHGLARFDTDVKNGESILVIKESYGNALVPYLAAHYETVYIIDPRRIEMDLSRFVSDYGIGHVLVVNYSSVLGNPTWKDGFRALIG